MMLDRRNSISVIAGLAIWPVFARAATAPVPVVAVLTNVTENDADESGRLSAFRQRFRQLGWIDGENVRLEIRWTGATLDNLETLVLDIVGLNPRIIFVVGTTTVSAVLRHTHSIPVVFVTGVDPVENGFVKSLARPSTNATGFAEFEDRMGTKWLQLLKEIAPAIDRVIFLRSSSRASLTQLPAMEANAAAFGVQLLDAPANNTAEIEQALGAYSGQKGLGLIVPPSSVAAVNRKLIAARATQLGFPAIYANRRYVADGGGLMSYGVDRVDEYRQAATYVNRILRGENPDTLPVQLPTKYELVINQKAAKAIGLTVPATMFALVTEVIE
jgi:putative tryptophan/tyrosine transport system substrate-binding protein